MNISVEKIAPPVAFVIVGSIMLFVGGAEAALPGIEQFVIREPIVRIIFIVLGVFLVLLGPYMVWRETTISKSEIHKKVSFPLPTIDLSGVWSCNDKAAYYLRQIDNEIFWLGESTPENPRFCNVAHGVIDSDEVRLDWADIAKGRNRHFGKLVLKVTDNGTHMEAMSRERFGGSSWTKLS